MPKASHKLKHGCKAGRSEDLHHQGASAARKEATSGSYSRPAGSDPPRPHHKSSSQCHPSRVEARWDKVLQKLCAKASGHQPSAKEMTMVSPYVATASDSGVQVDQLSLQDCPAVIQPADLWGSPAVLDPGLPADSGSTPPTVGFI